MVFSHDGRQIIAGIEASVAAKHIRGEFIISWWDTKTGEITKVLRDRQGPYFGLSLSPDGSRLVSNSVDLKIWDVATGQELQTVNTISLPWRGVAFSPDGTRVAVGTYERDAENKLGVTILDSRPLTHELRSQLNDVNLAKSRSADNLVASLFAEHPLNADVIAALKVDTNISESVRSWAIDQARKRPINRLILNEWAYVTACEMGLSTDKYQLARRVAEAVCEHIPPGHPETASYLWTLGIARYRVGKYAEAVEILSRSDQLWQKSKRGSRPTCIATLVMAHYKLGHFEDAYKLLEQLRQLMQTGKWKENENSRSFFEEAMEVVAPTPVHAERPAKRQDPVSLPMNPAR